MTQNKQILLIYFFLTVTTWISFQQVGSNGFVNLDDPEYITENGHIQNGITIEGLRWAFTTGHAANWHPLTWISHMLDIQFFGLNPSGHHLMNLLFHVANVLLLFFVLNRMTGALWQSAFVAALFALHPLHVESVAWIAERKDVLSTFFWMLTLVAYGYYAGNPRLRNYLPLVVFFALGLMAKPMLVTLPFVLLLLDYWPLGRFEQEQPAVASQTVKGSLVSTGRKKGKAGKHAPKIAAEVQELPNRKFQWASVRPLVLEKIPLFGLTALACAATYLAQRKAGAIITTESYAPGMRIANGLVSYFIYVIKTILPDNLAVFYPHPGLRPLGQVLGAVLFLIAVTFGVIRAARRFPYLPVGWLWFAGMLVPVIGLVQVGAQAMADRYMYIPSIGLFIMAAWGIPETCKKRRYGKEALAVCSTLCLLWFFILTRTQVGYWRDSIALFDHTLNVTRNNFYIRNNRGHSLAMLGNQAEAIEDFDRAIEINPDYAEAYNNRGIVYNAMGKHTRAVEDFDRATEIDPGNAHAYNNRGSAYMALGNPQQAVKDYNRAIEIDPHYADAHYNRGIFYQSIRMYRQAIEDYDKAIENDFPNLAEILCNRGAAYGQAGDKVRAIQDYDMAIGVNPEYAKAYFNRGLAYGELGNPAQAIRDYDKAIAINPEYPKAYFNRGMLYEALGKQSQAAEDIKTAARLGSENARDLLRRQKMD